MKIYINAMAEVQKEVERKLSGRTDKVITHLLYLCLAPNSTTVNHWIDEIYSFIHDIEMLKGKNKYPKKEKIYNWTYGKKQDRVNKTGWLGIQIEDALDKENLETYLTVNQVMDMLDVVCDEYFTWLSAELSTIGAVSRRSVQKKVHELLDMHVK